MDNKEIETHFKNLWFMYHGKKGKEVNKLIVTAMIAGLQDFWKAYPWAFKERNATVTTTASSEFVDLPDDLEGILSVREKTTTNGRKLVKMTADEYDRRVPDSSSINNGTPQAYKIFFDSDKGAWRLALYPTPSSALTLYINYHTMVSATGSLDQYTAVHMAAIAKHMYIPGTPERRFANYAFIDEVERLKNEDSPDKESIGKVLTEYENDIQRSLKWWESQ